ncbi:deoxyribodipyrimidine photo-lyase [Hyphobacterium sp. HN65]|uniref:Deoxyribodipyrimidine photo-lyase n=1 Tax=Hyphobacterium lacteum TaxID=3116575 RepID=A0ABU7LM34_9PROT|nr:deoxyribodipyrimidine photo-lyase [Hyphobacterium sp. HN65]MEE2524985.1 deoxyribodipyrimidine photo-lyase [Hyphobacterium sp. HN65]
MSPPTSPVIVWFRQDLRIKDNPALSAAAESGRPVIPVFILDDESPGKWKAGGASRWWLHHSLTSLASDLKALGAPMVLRSGHSASALDQLVKESGAGAVFWNRCYEPHARERDEDIKSSLKARNIDVQSFNASLLAEPWTVKNKSGDPFRVFSPFWRSVRSELDPGTPLEAPSSLKAPDAALPSENLGDWGLLPTQPDWAKGFEPVWTPGEAGARDRLIGFFDHGARHYAGGRDRPDKPYTSALSPHLHFGEISPRQIFAAIQLVRDEIGEKNAEKFLSEIGWREFSVNLLFHFPHFPERNYQDKFDNFPWIDNQAALKAWQTGQTGYPIVDAGMRELWTTGWMHNRVRMIVASFLIKHLLIDWREGEKWFWDTLVDADLANNSASWQWVAGSGADAAPYFRIFNPITQGEKFDPDGDYVRKWVPEIARLPNKYLNQPWEAGPLILKEAGIELGKTYPEPIVDHKAARDRALMAFQSLKDAA